MEFLNVPPELAPLFQLTIAMLLGMLIGAERDIAGKTAGIRTHALVGIGATLITIISTGLTAGSAGADAFDPVRLTAGVVAGIGFLCAGIIIFKKATLRGLTTAAGLWVTAAVGIAVGYQFYLIAIFATFLTLFVFRVLWYVEQYLERHFEKRTLVSDIPDETPHV